MLRAGGTSCPSPKNLRSRRRDPGRDPLIGMRALVETVRARQRVLDEFLRRLGLRDTTLKLGHVLAQQIRAIHRIRRREQRTQLPQAKARLLADQDDRDPFQIGLAVTALPARDPAGRQQPHGLPVPQHMRGQPEPARELPDGHPA